MVFSGWQRHSVLLRSDFFLRLCGSFFHISLMLLANFVVVPLRKTIIPLHCVDASELHGKIETFDDEHFCTDSEQIIAQSVYEWIVDARSLRFFKVRDVQEPTRLGASKVGRVRNRRSGAASARDSPPESALHVATGHDGIAPGIRRAAKRGRSNVVQEPTRGVVSKVGRVHNRRRGAASARDSPSESALNVATGKDPIAKEQHMPTNIRRAAKEDGSNVAMINRGSLLRKFSNHKKRRVVNVAEPSSRRRSRPRRRSSSRRRASSRRLSKKIKLAETVKFAERCSTQKVCSRRRASSRRRSRSRRLSSSRRPSKNIKPAEEELDLDMQRTTRVSSSDKLDEALMSLDTVFDIVMSKYGSLESLHLRFNIDKQLNADEYFMMKCLARIIRDGIITVNDLKERVSDASRAIVWRHWISMAGSFIRREKQLDRRIASR